MENKGKNSSPQEKLVTHWHFNNWKLTPETNQVHCGKQVKSLEPKAVQVLLYLAENKHRVISSQELLDNIWQDVSVNENVVRRLIAQLRKTFEDTQENPWFIATVPRKGYILKAPAKKVIPGKTHLPFYFIGLLLFIAPLYWYHLNNSNENYSINNKATPFTSLVGRELTPNLSDDGKYIVFSHALGDHNSYQLKLQAVNSTASQNIKGAIGSAFSPSLSPSNKLLAYADLATCQIYLAKLSPDLTQILEQKAIYQCGKDTLPFLTWSHDERILYFNHQEPTTGKLQLFQYSLDSGEVKTIDLQFPQLSYGFFKLAPHPTKNLWALFGRNDDTSSEVWLYNLDDDSFRLLYQTKSPSYNLDWCGANGEHLLVGDNNKLIRLDIDNSKHSVIHQNNSSYAYLTCATHSNLLVYANRNRNSSLIQLQNPSLNQPLVNSETFIFRSTYSESFPRWSNNSNRLAFNTNRTGKWEVWGSLDNSENLVPKPLTNNRFDQPPYIFGWSFDDNYLLINIKNRLALVTISSGELSWLTPENRNVNYASWSSKPNQFYISFFDSKHLFQGEVNSSEFKKTSVTNIATFSEYNNGEDILYTKNTENGLWRYNFSSKTHQLVTPQIPANSRIISINQDVYFHHHGDEYQLAKYNIANDKLTDIFNNQHDQGHNFSVSHDNNYIVYEVLDNYQSNLMLLKFD